MAKAPAFQFYPSDFLTGTASFRPEERGAYITLLCIQWANGGIEYDDFEHLSGVHLERLKRVLAKFEKCEDGLYRNSRLEETRARQIEFSKKQKEKIKKRWNNTETIPEPIPDSYQTDTNNGNTIKEDRSMKIEDEEVIEGKDEVLRSKKFIPPNRPDAAIIFSVNCPSHWTGLHMDNEITAWFDYYNSNGWKVGKNKMKDWKASIRTWIRNDYNFSKSKNGNSQQKRNSDEAKINQRLNELIGN